VSKPSGSSATLSNPSISMPSVTTDKVGDYVFSLTVTDSSSRWAPSARKRSTSGSSPPPTATCGSWCRTASSSRICSIA
jgi:hypothetical protein